MQGMKTRLEIHEILKDLRVAKGLNLEQLAEETKISKSALGSYEADESKDISLYNLMSWRTTIRYLLITCWGGKIKTTQM